MLAPRACLIDHSQSGPELGAGPWSCVGGGGREQGIDQGPVGLRVEQGGLDPVEGEDVGVGSGEAFDESLAPETPQVVAHLG